MKNLLLILFIFASFSSHAAVVTWNGGFSNEWNDANNWDINQVPTAIDDVVIGSFTNPFTFVSIFSANAVAKSITITNAQLSLANTRMLVVDGVNPSHPTAIHIDSGALQNNGVFQFAGGMKAINSTITNANVIFSNGYIDNSPISLELDNSLFNNINPLSALQFQNNIESTTGNRKDIFLKATNSSTVLNNGFILNTYNATSQDWANKGIEINNNSTVNNMVSSLISLTSMQEIGIHIKNDNTTSPVSQLINRGILTISKCTVCSFGEFTCGIRVEENASYDNYPTVSSVTITDYTDVNDSDICIAGRHGSFGNFMDAAVDMSNYTYNPFSVLQGTGVIIIDDGMTSSFSGTIQPGLNVGKIVFEGNFTSTSTTTFQMGIEGAGEPGMMMGYDQIEWGTDETSISMATLQVVLENGFIPNVGDEFQLFVGSASGEFENLNLPGDDDSWQVTYGPNGILLEVIAPISNVYNVGIGTDTPKTKLEINGGDVLLSSIGTGVVLTSPGGFYYKITVDDNGALQTELIPCPEVWECP